MRAWLAVAIGVGVVCVAKPAHAQFQNHSIGFSVGYIHLDAPTGFSDALAPPAFAVDGTIYIENGFDLGLKFGFAVQQDVLGSQVVMLYPSANLRYFLVQDFFRPFVGVNLTYVHAFDSDADTLGNVASDNYIGLGPMIGFDYFFSEEWSVGVSAEFAGYFALNAGTHYSIQSWARLATHF